MKYVLVFTGIAIFGLLVGVLFIYGKLKVHMRFDRRSSHFLWLVFHCDLHCICVLFSTRCGI